MPTPHERASKLWFELTCLIPFAEGDYDPHVLTAQCEALIVKAMIPPIDKGEAWDRLLAELGTPSPALIEALYVYREAILKWQREVIDSIARDAELAIRALRGYTRSQE